MMTHYLITPKGSTPQERAADLNRIVDQFDLARYLKQFDETGADWLVFTLGTGNGIPLQQERLYRPLGRRLHAPP